LLILKINKYKVKNFRGQWVEDYLQKTMRTVRINEVSTSAVTIHYKGPATLQAHPGQKQRKGELGRTALCMPQ